MKKLFFTIVFLSVISFIGISKVNALPSGSSFDNWVSNRVLLGNMKTDTGANMPLYGYNGSGNASCPYLGTTNQLAFLPCYNESEYGSHTSLLVGSAPLCNAGNCAVGGSVMNLTIGLSEADFLEQGVKYNLQVDIGFRSDITEEYFTRYQAAFETGRNFQMGYGVVTDYKVECYHSNESSYYEGHNYCSLSFDFIPDRLVGIFYVDFTFYEPLADFNYYTEWLLYPKINEEIMSNLQSYSISSSQYAFISGLKEGSIYVSKDYELKEGSYVNYFDINRNTQPYTSFINYPKWTNYFDYFYYEYNINDFTGADLVMFSMDNFKATGFPYDRVEFFVSYDAYVDIVSMSEVGSVGNTLSFNYKNPDTGVVSRVTVNSFSLDSDSSTLFGNLSSGLDIFSEGIESVGYIFSGFFNELNSPLSWFLILIFSFGILAFIISVFM